MQKIKQRLHAYGLVVVVLFGLLGVMVGPAFAGTNLIAGVTGGSVCGTVTNAAKATDGDPSTYAYFTTNSSSCVGGQGLYWSVPAGTYDVTFTVSGLASTAQGGEWSAGYYPQSASNHIGDGANGAVAGTGGTFTQRVTVPTGVTGIELVGTDSFGDQGHISEVSITSSPTAAPAVPAGLTAAAGNSQVALSWAASTTTGANAATGYYVYRGGVQIATVAGTSYTDTGLTNGTAYTYTVAAYNSGYTSSQSGGVTSTPNVPIPATPTGVAASVSGQSASVTWSASTYATGYKVYRSIDGGTTYTLKVDAGSATSYTDSSLTAGSTYWYRVTAYNGSGESAASSGVSVTAKFSPPAGLAGSMGDKSAALSWQSVTGASGYKLYTSTTGGQGWAAPVDLGNVTGYTVTGLTNGTAYTFEVTAYGSLTGTESLGSNAVTVTPAGPLTPTGLTASASSGQVSLSWSPSAGAASYNLYRSVNGGAWVITATSSTGYVDTAVTNGSTYTYAITAIGSAGSESAISSSVQAKPVFPPPVGLAGTATDAKAALSWQSVSGSAGYKLYTSTDGGHTWASPVDVGNVTAYNVTGLTDGTAYTFEVTAYGVGVGTESLGSNSVTVTPIGPGTPTGLVGTPGNGQVSLSWGAVSGAVSYDLYRSTDGGKTWFTPIAVLGTTYTDTGLTNAQAYTYAVSGVGSGGTVSGKSAAVTVTPKNTSPPPVPGGLTAAFDSTSNTAALSWSAVSSPDLASYKVYLSTDGGGSWSVVSSTGGTTYTATSLQAGHSYLFGVSAINTSGYESAKATVSVKAPVAPPPTVAQAGSYAADQGKGLAQAGSKSFGSIWYLLIGLIALVVLSQFIVSRAKKGAALRDSQKVMRADMRANMREHQRRQREIQAGARAGVYKSKGPLPKL